MLKNQSQKLIIIKLNWTDGKVRLEFILTSNWFRDIKETFNDFFWIIWILVIIEVFDLKFGALTLPG